MTNLAITILGANAGEKAAFFLAQGLQAFALDFFQQLVHAALLGLALLHVALHFAGGAALQPALPDARPAPLARRRLVALETGVTLRKIVAEHRILAAVLQDDVLPLARHVDEQSQGEKQHAV